MVMRDYFKQNAVYATWATNDFDTDSRAFVPELWAQESLMILEANMVMGQLVHRDFSPEIQNFGDVVNTRKPGTFNAGRKIKSEDVTIQSATADKIAVPLNQHVHTSFVIRDGEEATSMKSLIVEYLEPAVKSIAEAIDRIVAFQMYQFMENSSGKLDQGFDMTQLIGAREVMNSNKAPLQGRQLVIPPSMEGDLLAADTFQVIQAEKVGDDGTAMREGSLGRKMGYNIFMSQHLPEITGTRSTRTGAVNNSAGYAAGSTVITCDTWTTDSYNPNAGEWVVIAGDYTPQLVVNYYDSSDELVIYPGLKRAVANNAAITCYTAAAINETDGYAANWHKQMDVDGLTYVPSTGHLLSMGTPSTTAWGVKLYGALPQLGTALSTTSLAVDRPLEAAVANNAVIGVGPNGNYGFAFHRNAITLVSRPLPTPLPSAGAMSYVASYNGLSIRVTITYDGEKQGHLVTVDTLMGIKVLDTDLGCVIYG